MNRFIPQFLKPQESATVNDTTVSKAITMARDDFRQMQNGAFRKDSPFDSKVPSAAIAQLDNTTDEPVIKTEGVE